MTREAAYAVVQKNAMAAWEKHLEFKDLLKKDKQVNSFLKAKEIDDVFQVERFLKHVDFIFRRVFQE